MKFSTIINWLSKPKNLWITMFFYTILTGLFVQLILLPYIFPSWHSGNGLLVKMDGQKFHKIALALSEIIKSQGWSQWKLLPDNQLVSGIAAICYTLIYPAPWSVLPVNALLNASACVCQFLIISSFVEDRQKSVIATLPFMFMPSNLLWNTQFHNENYAIPGVTFILYGWLLITLNNQNKQPVTLKLAVQAIVLIVIGSIFLGLVRVYILAGMSYLLSIAGIAIAVYWLIEKPKAREYIQKILPVLSACAIMIITNKIVTTKIFPNLAFQSDSSELLDVPAPSAKAPSAKTAVVKFNGTWNPTPWLPQIVDNQLRNIARYRSRFVRAWDEAGSSIDLNVVFGNSMDMLAYIPRSIQIGFLAPFPNIWFSTGKTASGSAMRIASAFETIFIYFCFLGLPAFLWINRKQPATWMILFVCGSLLIIYAMIIPNLGSLYRFRYPYIMPLVDFGLAGWLLLAIKKHLSFGNRKPL